MTEPLSREKVDAIEKAAKYVQAVRMHAETFTGAFALPAGLAHELAVANDQYDALLDPATVLGLVARARRADELEKVCALYQIELVGVSVKCKTCGLRKTPRGRSAPLEMANGLCDHECPGYSEEPRPGSLWPGETRLEFGYP